MINSPETMIRAIREKGVIPFFRCAIPGFSIQEMTAPGCWFDDEDGILGPWDWKIDCVQSGDIAYGKFLCGGKAAFATVEWYKELMNVRRASTRPDPDGRKILDFVQEHGSITSKEIRLLLGIKKAAADSIVTRLQHQCRLITGDIQRVFRGPNLNYVGWQTASFCTPEALFPQADEAFSAFPGFPFGAGGNPLATSNTPQQSLEALTAHIASMLPDVAEHKLISKVLR